MSQQQGTYKEWTVNWALIQQWGFQATLSSVPGCSSWHDASEHGAGVATGTEFWVMDSCMRSTMYLDALFVQRHAISALHVLVGSTICRRTVRIAAVMNFWPFVLERSAVLLAAS